jgi:hypothetical protein
MKRNELKQQIKVVLVDRLSKVRNDHEMAELWRNVLGSSAIEHYDGGVVIHRCTLNWVLGHALDGLIAEMPEDFITWLLRINEEEDDVLEESLDDCE